METNTKKGGEAQGVGPPKKKKQAASASYTLHSFNNTIVKLVELKLISEGQAEQLVKIKDEAVKEYMRINFGS